MGASLAAAQGQGGFHHGCVRTTAALRDFGPLNVRFGAFSTRVSRFCLSAPFRFGLKADQGWAGDKRHVGHVEVSRG
jgi:hypothetical protein